MLTSLSLEISGGESVFGKITMSTVKLMIFILKKIKKRFSI
jgi:hypothetical protein